MTSSLLQLKNIGTRTAAWLQDIGIHTVEDLKAMGPVTAYKRLKGLGYHVNTVFVFAVQGALMDLHWNALPPELKAVLSKACREES